MFGGVEHESLNPQRLQRTSDVSEKDNLYARPMLKRKKKVYVQRIAQFLRISCRPKIPLSSAGGTGMFALLVLIYT